MSASASIDGLYVHVPFCDGKCAYCAFYSVPFHAGRVDAWLAALQTEYRQALDEWGPLTPSTIYFGGGTPTLLDRPHLERLLQIGHGFRAAEWSIEANPGSLDLGKLELLKTTGVTRISLGVQALDDRVLRFLGRRHTVADVRAAVAAIKTAGFDNWGLDLIACVPDVDRPQWGRTIREALAFEPRHVSVYALTSEEGSSLAGRLASGASRLLDDDEQLAMLADAEEMLAGADFRRYEISNYARPGYDCRHHLACWRGHNYIGLGCAAASRVGHRRWTNRPDLKGYIAAMSQDQRPPREEEILSPLTDATERLVFGLRMAEGVSLEDILGVTGLMASPAASAWQSTLQRLEETGLLVHRDDRWQLTSRGRELADYVAVELMQ
jgi:oxygen-independent coproporphyrinogen-3 oxidase